MNNKEKLMYSILGELGNSNIPLIFKGGVNYWAISYGTVIS